MLYNKNILEIAITYRCNLNCNNCGTLCIQAPCNFMDMSSGHLVKLFYDCKKNNHQFKEIHITGGEPTLHKDFDRLYTFFMGLLDDYKYDFKNVYWLTNYSNDFIKKWNDRIEDDGFNIGISEKRINGEYEYVTVNDAPCDSICQYLTDGCNISRDCGIAFNVNGYFPCTPMAAASRVFKDIKGVSSIVELTEEKIQEMFDSHCKRCGHSKFPDERSTKQVTSRVWKDALNVYSICNSNG